MPATCHSLISRYSLITSAARKERLRPVLLASLSNRFLAAEATRNREGRRAHGFDFLCSLVYNIARRPTYAIRTTGPPRLMLRFAATLPTLSFSPGIHVSYAETVLHMRDGLPKLKDFPSELGGSGESIAE